MQPKRPSVRVSLLATPDTFMSSLSGFYDTFSVSREMTTGDTLLTTEIVAHTRQLEVGMTRMPLVAHRVLDEIEQTDIIIIAASLMGDGASWRVGRHPEAVRWLRTMYDRGAVLCSACSGAFLLAETGLLDGQTATTHWAFEANFRQNFPRAQLKLERELVVSPDGRLVMSGASAAWHDLALYLLTRFSGPATARSAAKFFMMQWHSDGQMPYFSFTEPIDHGDKAILTAQAWLQNHWREPHPVEAMIAQSNLSERNFTRRFKKATGYTPLAYVQQFRIEKAKQRLENSGDAIDRIGWDVGYEDASFFRRLFKRTVGMRPLDYRRKFSGSPDLFG